MARVFLAKSILIDPQQLQLLCSPFCVAVAALSIMKLLCVLSALCCLSTAFPLVERSPSLSRRTRVVSPYSSDLKRRKSNLPHRLIKRQQIGDAGIIDDRQLNFLAQISFGDQTFDAILDSGSSDTWLIQTGFTCYDPSSGAQVDESYCNFGPTWTPDSSFTEYDNVNIRSAYGDGKRYIAGPLGYADVTLAGLTVPSQTVGAPNIVSKSPCSPQTSS